jgi:hypothetical protein
LVAIIKRLAWSCGLAAFGLAASMFMGLDMLILSKSERCLFPASFDTFSGNP